MQVAYLPVLMPMAVAECASLVVGWFHIELGFGRAQDLIERHRVPYGIALGVVHTNVA